MSYRVKWHSDSDGHRYRTYDRLSDAIDDVESLIIHGVDWVSIREINDDDDETSTAGT